MKTEQSCRGYRMLRAACRPQAFVCAERGCFFDGEEEHYDL